MTNSGGDDDNWGECEDDDNNENKSDCMNEEFRKRLDEPWDDDDVDASNE